MPDLFHTLHGHDLGFLKIIAGAWGLELQAPDADTALPILIAGMSNRLLAQEIIETLPNPARQAVHSLLDNEGQLSWSLFCRRFGEVRTMGAGKRDRERPDLNPASPAEVLWYRGLIGKAFFNLPPEPQEYAYIPEDLLAILEPLAIENSVPFGTPALSGEHHHPLPVSLRILDDTCTLLAALRSNFSLSSFEDEMLAIPSPVLIGLCKAAGLIDEEQNPNLEKLRQFLEADQAQALAMLVKAWKSSHSFNDLRFVPGLVFEGEWQNDALQTRTVILSMVQQLPAESWWSLPAFIQAVRERQPDFQRPAGDYDSWFIRHAETGSYLRGFSSWDEVDGALLQFIISGPLHWLGMVELAAPQPGADPVAFRLSQWAGMLWEDHHPKGFTAETGSIHINRDGTIRISQHAPRAERYQISRFCEWKALKNGVYHYYVTPSSLERAAKQGLQPAHLHTFLSRIPDLPIPPSLLKALKRFEKQGTQAWLEKATLLRVDTPEIIEALQKSPAARHISDVLNPTTVLVKAGKLEKVRNALAELGYLVD